MLLAAGRTDVAGLAAVAANLDTDAWTVLHRVAPLRDSRNPMDAAAAATRIPQAHFTGSRDRITPPWRRVRQTAKSSLTNHL